MILEFKVKNFLSFKDEQILSFEATDDNYLDDYHTIEVKPGLRILKMAMIYGANASGKSNLLNAMDFLFDTAFNNDIDFENFSVFRYDLENMNIPTNFNISFFIGEVKFEYELKLNSESVLFEELNFYPKEKRALIYSRIKNKDSYLLKFGSKFKVNKSIQDFIELNISDKNTVISTFEKVKYKDKYNVFVRLLLSVSHYFRNQFSMTLDLDVLWNEILQIVHNDEKYYKEFILKNLKKSDFNITDFSVLPRLYDNQRKYDIVFSHDYSGEKYEFIDYEESNGTLIYFFLLVFLKEIIEDRGSQYIDEIETSLHPDLINHYLNLFLNETKGKPLQFIFTTHNIGLLDEDFVRKDIVWFTEKKEDGSTDLFSLVEFDISADMSISKAYKMGKFGATPILGLIY